MAGRPRSVRAHLRRQQGDHLQALAEQARRRVRAHAANPPLEAKGAEALVRNF
jgi:hypothetical protein